MDTKIVEIDNMGVGLDEALLLAERFAEQHVTDQRTALRFRLLAEEAVGMVRSVTGTFRGQFFIRTLDEHRCEIHVRTMDKIDFNEKQELIALSASGKNEASQGLMARLVDLMGRGLHNVDEVNRVQVQYGASTLMFGTLGMYDMSNVEGCIWSLASYRNNLQGEMEGEGPAEGVQEALDDLEHSIVASIADDVKVYIEHGQAEIVIEKSI